MNKMIKCVFAVGISMISATGLAKFSEAHRRKLAMDASLSQAEKIQKENMKKGCQNV